MSPEQSPPSLFYGTAWKEEATAGLTFQALQSGFRAIDTANQRKHYNEEGVGHGLQSFLRLEERRREDLFLQTKFTYARGQDHRKPYTESDPYSKQVRDSFQSSLNHLGVDFIDSYILHGPYSASGISCEDLEVWSAMESLLNDGKVHHLGISNVTLAQLSELYSQARHKPVFVQNRCYARLGWDKDVREFCRRNGVRYQGFSLLTANKAELQNPLVGELNRKYKKSTGQIVFRFCQQIGMICLTGTTNSEHMRQDLDLQGFELTPEELELMETLTP